MHEETLLNALQATRNWGQAMAAERDDDLVAALVAQIEDEDLNGRLAALEFLADLGRAADSPETRSALTNALSEPSSEVRAEAAKTVGKVIAPASVEGELRSALVRLVTDPGEPIEARLAGVESLYLAVFPDWATAEVESLLTIATDRTEEGLLRRRVMNALAGVARWPKVREAFRTLAEEDPDGLVRAEALALLDERSENEATKTVKWMSRQFGLSGMQARDWLDSLLRTGVSHRMTAMAAAGEATFTMIPVLGDAGPVDGLEVTMRWEQDEIRAKLEAKTETAREALVGRKAVVFVPDESATSVIRFELDANDVGVFRLIGFGPESGWIARLAQADAVADVDG